MSTTMTLYYFDRDQPVRTVEELDDLLDRLTEEAVADNRPLYVQLATEDGTRGLQVALGRDYSTLEYHDASDPANPRLDISQGIVHVPENDEFDLGGTPTSVRTAAGISVDDAREAVREFFRTRKRPSQMQWQVSGFG